MRPTPKRLVGCELIALAASQPEPFAALCERNYRARIDSLAGRLVESGRRIVMLTGPSATGKTTSANKLAAAVEARGRSSTVLSLDDFFVGEGRYPKRADGADDYECLEALDLPLLRDCLRQLHETGRCQAPVFDFLTQMPGGSQEIDCRDGLVIVEGLHALNPALTDHLPQQAVFRIYASLREEYTGPGGARCLATRDIRLARRLVRDALFRGHGPDFTLDLWDHVCESEDRYIKVYKSRADAILDTTHSYEVCLWGPLLAAEQGKLRPGSPNAARFAALCERMAVFPPVQTSLVPADSMLREFIGAGGAEL